VHRIQCTCTFSDKEEIMIKTAIIVDDLAERAKALLVEAKSRGFNTYWWCPMPDKLFREAPEKDGEIRLENKISLINAINGAQVPILWIWDIQLIFHLQNTSLEKFETLDYEWPRNQNYEHVGEEPKLRKLLLTRLTQGDAMVLMSSVTSANLIHSNWITDYPNISEKVYSTTESWTDMVSERSVINVHCKLKSEWVTSVINKALDLAGYKNKPNLRDIWIDDYKGYFNDGDIIDHELNKTSKENFWSFLKSWWKLHNDSFPLLKAEIISNFSGYFYTTMTLLGGQAHCHTQGYLPCLGVIGLLTIRAALLSGHYNDIKMANLAKQVMPRSNDREIVLSDHLQEKCLTQEWLCILGDQVLPILVANHEGDEPAINMTWKYDKTKKSFTVKSSENWEEFLKRYHMLDGKKGNLTQSLIKLNVSIGDCGTEIGRRQRCVINAFQEKGNTIFEFAVI